MIWLRLILTLLAWLMAIYYVMVILQCFSAIRFTRRNITLGRLLIPFYYWIAPIDEKNNTPKTN